MPHTLLTPRISFESFCQTTRRSALLAGLAWALAGCGGSPSSETVIPSSFDVAQLQGRWVTGAGVTPGYTALVLPPQASTAQAWVLAQDASSLTRLNLVGGATLSVSGKSYSLTGAALGQPVSAGASAVANLSASPKTLTLSSLSTSPIVLSLSDGLAGPPVQADASGSWRASAGQDGRVVNWSISAGGVVTGTSTTGCSWSGAVTAMGNAPVFNANLTETCAATASVFSGIATVNSAKTNLTVAGTLTDESKAWVLLFGR